MYREPRHIKERQRKILFRHKRQNIMFVYPFHGFDSCNKVQKPDTYKNSSKLKNSNKLFALNTNLRNMKRALGCFIGLKLHLIDWFSFGSIRHLSDRPAVSCLYLLRLFFPLLKSKKPKESHCSVIGTKSGRSCQQF